MASYRVDDRTFEATDPELGQLLPRLHRDRLRPLCCCIDAGVPMYVARVNGRFIVKRMPESGDGHAPTCDSYEAPPELSGLGQLLGTAVLEDPEKGSTTLRLDFPLSRSQGKSGPIPAGAAPDSIRTDGARLTLRGLLHLLWEHAGFHRWSPAMAGKRTWWVIRKHLLAAAEDKTAKGSPLADLLFVPEQFYADRREEIAQRRLAQMTRIASTGKGARQLMVVVGEVKEIAPARFGHRLILKHLGDCPLMLDDELHRRLLNRYEIELGLWSSMASTHLMMVGTFGFAATGVASLEEVALMNVNEGWIPFENTFEKTLLDVLTHHHRRYVKCLRYNLPSTKPLACAVMSDTIPATAMYVVPPRTDEEVLREIDALISDSKLPAWRWMAGMSEMPMLPRPASRPSTRPSPAATIAIQQSETSSRPPPTTEAGSKPLLAQAPSASDFEGQ